MAKMKLMNNYSNSNNNELTQIHQSLWSKGKAEYKKFGDYNFKKSTFWRTTLGGMLYTLLCILPFVVILVAFFNAFYYSVVLKIILCLIGWGILLVANGLSNYFTVQMSKTYITDDEKLQKMDAVAIMFYNCFNIGYMICSLLLVIIIIMVTI